MEDAVIENMESLKPNNNYENNLYNHFQNGPRAPEGSRGMLEYTSFASNKEALTNEKIDPAIEKIVNSVIESWLSSPNSVEPFMAMRDILEEVRQLPPDNERIRKMNSIIRTLGQPDKMAAYLDMLRDSATRYGTAEQKIVSEKLQAVKMHSIYGWCGNTLLVESLDSPTKGTYRSNPELGRKLGNAPAAWNLTLHIWQPNLTAKGFPIDSPLLDTNSILEPPHAHPFNFVSTIVKGTMRQSIYKQRDARTPRAAVDANNKIAGYYDQGGLVHVDGIWPPHDFHETSGLQTLEHRVLMKEGDSYYMPCDWIHDVEFDADTAASKPSISLFSSSEYVVMPHVYMTPTMADFHSQNPDIKRNGAPISEDAWHKKLKAISAYLRGESETLDLNKIVNWRGEYAFFNVKRR